MSFKAGDGKVSVAGRRTALGQTLGHSLLKFGVRGEATKDNGDTGAKQVRGKLESGKSTKPREEIITKLGSSEPCQVPLGY